jgi:hypothetical protein
MWITEMSKIIFIRHAEPKRDCGKDPGIVMPMANPEHFLFGHTQVLGICSSLKRSQETLANITNSWNQGTIVVSELNEWDKETESKEAFMGRVNYGLSVLKELAKNQPNGILVCGHSRWMVAAHWILKNEIALGFDYLEGFEVTV